MEPPYYMSHTDPTQFTPEDGALTQDVSFTGLFEAEKEAKQEDFAGRYAMWGKLQEDPDFLASPITKSISTTFEKMDGYESIFVGMLAHDLLEVDMQRMGLPQEPREIFCAGPECKTYLGNADVFFITGP